MNIDELAKGGGEAGPPPPEDDGKGAQKEAAVAAMREMFEAAKRGDFESALAHMCTAHELYEDDEGGGDDDGGPEASGPHAILGIAVPAKKKGY